MLPGAAFLLLLIGACLFIPTFVIAIVMLRSVTRAFVLSATFTMGALAGALVAMLGSTLIERADPREITELLQTIFLASGAVAGGVLALFLLGRLSKTPPWRRN